MPANISDLISTILRELEQRSNLSTGCLMTDSPMSSSDGNPDATLRPLIIETGSGRIYGATGEPRFGIWFDSATNSWHYLGANGRIIPGTSWKPANLNRCKFTFNTVA